LITLKRAVIDGPFFFGDKAQRNKPSDNVLHLQHKAKQELKTGLDLNACPTAAG
jgi:hypothetical protein